MHPLQVEGLGKGSNPRAGIPCEEWWECWPDHTLQCIEGFCTEAPNPALGEPCSDGGDCWSKHGLVCAGGTCVEPECQEDSDCEDDMFCSYGKCFMPPCIVYCAPCGDFYCDEGYLNGYSCSECWDNLGSDGDNWAPRSPTHRRCHRIAACSWVGVRHPVAQRPIPGGCVCILAEYVLGLGPMVGCYQDSYPDPLFMDGRGPRKWMEGGSPADGLAYAQEWWPMRAMRKGALRPGRDLVSTPFLKATEKEEEAQRSIANLPLRTLPDELPQNAFQWWITPCRESRA